MATLIINGREASLDEHLFSSFHGASVFTTLRSKNGSLCFWHQHWQRLVAHAQFFAFGIPDERVILEGIYAQMHKANHDLKIRVIINHHNYAILTEPRPPVDPQIYKGVSVILSRYQVHPQLASFKTGNYLPYALALKEAESLGAFEGMLTNIDGFLVDGARTSLMLFKDYHLIALAGGLHGVMRQAIMAYAKKSHIKISTQWLRPHELDGQLLLSNSLLGLVPVGAPQHPFILELIEYFRS